MIESPVLFSGVMRVYKFLCAEYALKCLRERRLKQSTVNDLNDPFELTPYDITDPVLRETFLLTRNAMHNGRGMLCFSADWNDPVMWANYNDKHQGVCLGFEIPKVTGSPEDESGYVKYIADPLYFPPNYSELEETERLEIVRKILFTKFKHWQYEHEIRVWAPLQPEENDLRYVDFSESLRLVEVIIGAKCKVSQSVIMEALAPIASEVKVIKARAAYDRFQMVVDNG